MARTVTLKSPIIAVGGMEFQPVAHVKTAGFIGNSLRTKIIPGPSTLMHTSLNLRCYRCGTEMVPGVAIRPNMEEHALTIAPVAPITSETLVMVDVLKCPTCGHSEFMTAR
jgi:ribosomal protein S27AE